MKKLTAVKLLRKFISITKLWLTRLKELFVQRTNHTFRL